MFVLKQMWDRRKIARWMYCAAHSLPPQGQPRATPLHTDSREFCCQPSINLLVMILNLLSTINQCFPAFLVAVIDKPQTVLVVLVPSRSDATLASRFDATERASPVLAVSTFNIAVILCSVKCLY